MNIEIEDNPKVEDIQIIKDGLQTYNESKNQFRNGKMLAVFLRDKSGDIKGGFYGSTKWGWLYIQHIWVDKSLRGCGYGRQLLVTAEKQALKRNCKHSYVDTLSFQNACEFYKTLGYEKFGELDHFPEGHSLLFMRKMNIKQYYITTKRYQIH